MKLSEMPPGQGRTGHIAGRPVVVYNDGGTLRAFENICTHLECETEWNEDEELWECPCHGSRFSVAGAVARGPAERPLRPFPVRVVDDRIVEA